MKYQVYDGNKPADSNNHNTGKGLGWDNSIFDTLDKARQYVFEWCENYISLNEAEAMIPD